MNFHDTKVWQHYYRQVAHRLSNCYKRRSDGEIEYSDFQEIERLTDFR